MGWPNANGYSKQAVMAMENIKEAIEFVINGLITGVITLAVTTLTTMVVAFMRQKLEHVKQQIKSDAAKHFFEELEDIVSASVAHTSQTYVDALKKNKAFTAQAQRDALNKTKEVVMKALSPAAYAFFMKTHGTIQNILEIKIEEAVVASKS